METLALVALVASFVTMLIVGCVITVFGLPGSWLMIASALGYDWLMNDTSQLHLGWVIVIMMVVFAGLGELFEFIAGALGVTKTGGSRVSAALALGGSVVGAVVGAFVGLPVPVVGSVVGVVVFSGLGALVGAILGEYNYAGRDLESSLRVGMGAFWARLAGTLAKCLMSGLVAATGIAGLIL